MGDLDANKIKEALIRGITPLDQRISGFRNEAISKAWAKFVKSSTKKLMRGDTTVDEWKASFSGFAGELAGSVGGEEGEAILAEADGATAVVEEAFAPPSSMRWIVIGGIAATALAYWWMKREEKQNRRLLIATPEIVAGTPRRRPATIDIPEEDIIEAEEI